MEKKQVNSVKKKEYEILPMSDSFELPVRAKRGSVGYDLTVPEDFTVPAHSRCKIPLGFAINLPYGVEAKIEPRSGSSLRGMLGVGKYKSTSVLFGFIPVTVKKTGNHYFDADVLVGKIDPNYTDEINVIVKNNDEEFTIPSGTRIAQLTFYQVGSPFFKIVDKLTCKSRGGGFSSSGLNRISTKKKEQTEVEPAPAPYVSSEDNIKNIDIM
jgi:dUTPase